MMCDLRKISVRTNEYFNKLDKILKNTKDQYRYGLAVNGLNEVCFIDFRKKTEIKGNRNIQNRIKILIKEYEKCNTLI